MAGKLDRVDELHACLEASLHTETQHSTVAVLAEVLLCHGVVFVAIQAWVGHPLNLGKALEPLGNLVGVLTMPLHSQCEGLDTLEELEATERVLAHSEVTKTLHTCLEHKRHIWETKRVASSKGFPVFEAVITRGGLGEAWEATRGPVKGSSIHDDTSDGGTVSTDPLGAAFNNDVRSVLQRLTHVTSTSESIVTNQRNLILLRDSAEGLKVGDVELWVTDGLDVDSLGLIVDDSFEVSRIVSLHETDVNSHTGKLHFELIESTTIEIASRNKVVALLTNGLEAQELGGHSATGRESANATFKSSDPLLKDVVGWIHDTAVNVSELLQREEVRSVLGIVENIRASGVNGNRASIGSLVGFLPCVHHQRLKLLFSSHRDSQSCRASTRGFCIDT
mmetsp:Transcript_15493/g.18655  ORF Transcript_15493/g.18655 Transcript_15493/m.18655 type:complete len:393 (-) Transcript_15493:96-1274(-)